jgi:hypothetical protein
LSWRYNMCNALGYKMLDGFIKEHTPALKRQPDYKDCCKQVTTYIRLAWPQGLGFLC